MPSPGTIKTFHAPGGHGVRVDSHVYSGYKIPPYYDSMVGKLIIYGKDREEALARCKRALDEFIVEGIKTTIPFAHHIVSNPDFAAGKYNTGFLEKLMQEGF